MQRINDEIRHHGPITSVRPIGPAEIAISFRDGHERAVPVSEAASRGYITEVSMLKQSDLVIRFLFDDGSEAIWSLPRGYDRGDDEAQAPSRRRELASS